MNKPFSNLRKKMTPESQARADALTKKMLESMEPIVFTNQDIILASTNAANQIIMALQNYRATDPSGIRFTLLNQRDLPPALFEMLQAIVARHMRQLLSDKVPK